MGLNELWGWMDWFFRANFGLMESGEALEKYKWFNRNDRAYDRLFFPVTNEGAD